MNTIEGNAKLSIELAVADFKSKDGQAHRLDHQAAGISDEERAQDLVPPVRAVP